MANLLKLTGLGLILGLLTSGSLAKSSADIDLTPSSIKYKIKCKEFPCPMKSLDIYGWTILTTGVELEHGMGTADSVWILNKIPPNTSTICILDNKGTMHEINIIQTAISPKSDIKSDGIVPPPVMQDTDSKTTKK